MEETLLLSALKEQVELMEETLGRYRRSNRLLRRINSDLRRMQAIHHHTDETFKTDCKSETTMETYWGDPDGAIHRMSGEQEIIAVITDKCTNEEFLALTNITTNAAPVEGGLPSTEPSQTVGLEQQGDVSGS